MPMSLCRRNAQKKEIIKAYRKLAQQWHPDNFQDPGEKKKAEKKFIDIAQAKEVLTDPGKNNNNNLMICWVSEELTWTNSVVAV